MSTDFKLSLLRKGCNSIWNYKFVWFSQHCTINMEMRWKNLSSTVAKKQNKKKFLAFEHLNWSSKIYLMKIKQDTCLLWIKGLWSSCLKFYKEAADVCWTLLNSTEKLIQQWNRIFFSSLRWTFAFFNKTCPLDRHKNLPTLHIWTVQIWKMILLSWIGSHFKMQEHL